MRIAFSPLSAVIGLMALAVTATSDVSPAPAAHETADGRTRVIGQAPIALPLERLFASDGPETATLAVGGGTWLLQRDRLDDHGRGFRSWVGRVTGVDGSHVVFTERDGMVSGLINAAGRSFRVRTLDPGAHVVEELAPLAGNGGMRDAVADVVYGAPPADAPPAATIDPPTAIDVLMLYTPAARRALGGAPQIEVLAAQILSDTNTAFARSGVVPRLRLAGLGELPLREAPSMFTDLQALQASPDARNARDYVAADLVQLLVSSPDLSACGIAAQLSSLAVVDFDAYSVADVTCVGQYTPTHEMAHNMGAHHARDDGAPGALFDYSHGYKDPTRAFRTIMAYSCGTPACPRVPYFSSPSISVDGRAAGSPLHDNARTINDAAIVVANFRRAAAPPRTVAGGPQGLRSSVRGRDITLSWDPYPLPAVAGRRTASFVLQVGTQPGSADLFNVVMGAATRAAGVLDAGMYYWRVLVIGGDGQAAASDVAAFTVAPACLRPSRPTGLTLSRDGQVVTARWNPVTAADEVDYVMEAGTTPGASDLYAGGVGQAPMVTAFVPSGVYYLRVRATNACGRSLASDERRLDVP